LIALGRFRTTSCRVPVTTRGSSPATVEDIGGRRGERRDVDDHAEEHSLPSSERG
jgi:hypothetical protein